MKINDFFDKIYCINLDEATERWKNCVSQFNEFGINSVERFSAIKPNSGNEKLLKGELGILRSNYEVIKMAKEQNLKSILIFEDDFELSPNFNEEFSEYIKEVPEDWDFLYFGANQLGQLYKINEHVYKMTHSYALHTFAVKNTMYDLILSTLPHEEKQVDVYYANMMTWCNAYCFRPHISFQKDGYSYIQNGNVNYDFLRN